MNLTFLIIVLFMLLSGARYECVCIQDPHRTQDQIRSDRKKAFDNSKAIFEGKVVAIDPQTVTFQLNKRWKGGNSDVVTLSTGAVKGVDGTFIPKECGYQFTLGEVYLVFAADFGENIEANSCLTTLLKNAGLEENGLDQIRLHDTIRHSV